MEAASYFNVSPMRSYQLPQWRNRLARRTYKQYLPVSYTGRRHEPCGGCEFDPHLGQAFCQFGHEIGIRPFRERESLFTFLSTFNSLHLQL